MKKNFNGHVTSFLLKEVQTHHQDDIERKLSLNRRVERNELTEMKQTH
jgi:hypothetical protein